MTGYCALLFSTCLGLTACGRGGYEAWPRDTPPAPVECPSGISGVAPIYPVNGAAWSSYVGVTSPGLGPYSQPDTACDPHVSGTFWSCLQGGEKLRAVVTGVSSCEGLEIEDGLGAFIWECRTLNGVPTAVTQRLSKGVGLGRLLDPTTLAFRVNRVRVKRAGCTTVESPAGAWWNNPVTVVPDAGPGLVTELQTAGTIYVVPTSTTRDGLFLHEGVSLVVMPGQTLSWGGGSNDSCGSLRCLVGVESREFLWVEGSFDCAATPTSAGVGVRIYNSPFVEVHETSVRGCVNEGSNVLFSFADALVGVRSDTCDRGIVVDSSGGSLFERLRANGNTGDGIHLNGDGNRAYDIGAAFNGLAGISANGTGNALVGIYAADNDAGVTLYGSLQSSFVDLLVANNQNAGVSGSYTANNNVVHAISSVSNCGGVELTDITGLTLSQALLVNNSEAGLIVYDTVTDLAAHNLAALSNGLYGIKVNGTGNTNGSYHGNLVVGDNGAAGCSDTYGNPTSGLIVDTCSDSGLDGSATYAGQTSDARFHGTATGATTFVGAVTTDDPVNTSDTNGTAPFSPELDTFAFACTERAWGPGGSFPGDASRLPCLAGTCQIWDWRLSAADLDVRNRSGDAAHANEPFVAGQSCPAAAGGDRVVVDQRTPPQTYLLNALELVNDPARNPLGDNDGLCESGEGCLYLPNFGAYAGEGELTGPCLFAGSAVANVRLYARAVNGG